jgi:hypothetical protein
MSKIQDLMDLKLVAATGEDIYYDSKGANDMNLLKEGIEIVLRNEQDRDPQLANGYYGETGISVVVNVNGNLFKSHEEDDSYGKTKWSEWREVNPIPKIEYHYAESTY